MGGVQGFLPSWLPVTLCPCFLFLQRMSAQENVPVMNGITGPDSEDYNPWADRKAAQPKSLSPPQSQSKLSDSYSNTLPVRKSVTPKNSYATSKGPCSAELGSPVYLLRSPVMHTPEQRPRKTRGLWVCVCAHDWGQCAFT